MDTCFREGSRLGTFREYEIIIPCGFHEEAPTTVRPKVMPGRFKTEHRAIKFLPPFKVRDFNDEVAYPLNLEVAHG